MIKIDRSNYQNYSPGELADLFANNKASIIEASIEGLQEILKYAIDAFANVRGRLRKRVDALETALSAQLEINKALAARIQALEQK